MSIDDDLQGQLADYFGWLERDLGTTMRPAARPQRRPRRRLALAGAAAAVAALVATAVIMRDDDSRSVAPAASPTTATSVIGVAPTPAETDELTWAPLALPPTMEVVDTSETVDFGWTVGDTITRAQQFVRLAEDGSTVVASLSLTVRPAEGDEIAAWIPNGEVHGLPAIISTPSLTEASVWWVEDGRVVSADARGYDSGELLALVEPIEWRAVREEGFNPASIAGGLTLLYDSDLRAPRHFTSYLLQDLERDVFIRVSVSAPPRGFEFRVHPVKNGVLVESEQTRFRWVLVADDGAGVYVGYSPWTPEIDLEQATAIAEAMRLSDRSTLDELGADGSRRLAQQSLLATVPIGDRLLQLRGGTTDEPVALCVEGRAGTGCAYNDIDRDGDPFPDGASVSVVVDDEWLVIGYDIGSVGITEGQTSLSYPRQFCSASEDGSLIAALPDERASVDDREYFTVAVPAEVGYVRMCIDVDGELSPNSSGMRKRPSS